MLEAFFFIFNRDSATSPVVQTAENTYGTHGFRLFLLFFPSNNAIFPPPLRSNSEDISSSSSDKESESEEQQSEQIHAAMEEIRPLIGPILEINKAISELSDRENKIVSDFFAALSNSKLLQDADSIYLELRLEKSVFAIEDDETVSESKSVMVFFVATKDFERYPFQQNPPPCTIVRVPLPCLQKNKRAHTAHSSQRTAAILACEKASGASDDQAAIKFIPTMLVSKRQFAMQQTATAKPKSTPLALETTFPLPPEQRDIIFEQDEHTNARRSDHHRAKSARATGANETDDDPQRMQITQRDPTLIQRERNLSTFSDPRLDSIRQSSTSSTPIIATGMFEADQFLRKFDPPPRVRGIGFPSNFKLRYRTPDQLSAMTLFTRDMSPVVQVQALIDLLSFSREIDFEESVLLAAARISIQHSTQNQASSSDATARQRRLARTRGMTGRWGLAESVASDTFDNQGLSAEVQSLKGNLADGKIVLSVVDTGDVTGDTVVYVFRSYCRRCLQQKKFKNFPIFSFLGIEILTAPIVCRSPFECNEDDQQFLFVDCARSCPALEPLCFLFLLHVHKQLSESRAPIPRPTDDPIKVLSPYGYNQ